MGNAMLSNATVIISCKQKIAMFIIAVVCTEKINTINILFCDRGIRYKRHIFFRFMLQCFAFNLEDVRDWTGHSGLL